MSHGAQMHPPLSAHAPMCVCPGALLSPLGLIYVPWRLIYGPWGSSARPPPKRACPPSGIRPPPLGMHLPQACVSPLRRARPHLSRLCPLDLLEVLPWKSTSPLPMPC
jgi:hypothetical protein